MAPTAKANPLLSSPGPLSVLGRLAMTALVGLIVAAMGPSDGMVSEGVLDDHALGRSCRRRDRVVEYTARLVRAAARGLAAPGAWRPARRDTC